MEANELVERVNQRVRGSAHTDTFIRDLVSKCQQVVNAATRAVVETTAFTTKAYQQIYSTLVTLPNMVEILAVREHVNQDLEKLSDWRELLYRSSRWSREVRDNFETFCVLGRDTLIIHPAKSYDDEVQVVYTKLTTALENPDTPVDTPAERVQPILDLAEALLLLRERRFESFVPVLERLSRELSLDIRQ